jgi:hypothetical protein
MRKKKVSFEKSVYQSALETKTLRSEKRSGVSYQWGEESDDTYGALVIMISAPRDVIDKAYPSLERTISEIVLHAASSVKAEQLD